MAHYKLDSRRVTFAEYWRLSPNLLGVLWLWGAKLFGKQIRLAVGVPGPVPAREMIVDQFDISPEARRLFADIAADLAPAGLRHTHFVKVKDSLVMPHADISCADFVEPTGEFWARAFVLEQPKPLPKIKTFIVVFSRLADGRFVTTSNKARELKTASFVIDARVQSEQPTDVVAEHRRRIENFRSKPGLLAYRSEAEVEPWIDEYEKRCFDESRAEGRYIEMTPEEIAAARALKFPSAQPPPLPGAAGSEAFMPAYEKTAREVMGLMEQELNKTQNWTKSLLVFVVSLALFAAFAKLKWSGVSVILLLIVLFFHELGHFMAMKVFRYRSVRMFFIPFFGAAVTGKRVERAAWKTAIVALMGPIPGLALGFVIAIVAIGAGSVALERVAWILIVLNGFNLLPITPLDGGWVMQSLIFMRHPLAESVFKAVAAVVIILWGIQMHLLLFAALGGFMLLGVPINYKLAKIAKDLRTVDEGPVEGTYSPTLVEKIIEKVRPLTPMADLRAIANMTAAVYEKVVVKPAPIWATLVLLVVYVGFSRLAFVTRSALLTVREDPAVFGSQVDPEAFTFVLSDLQIKTNAEGAELTAIIGKPLLTDLELSLKLPPIGTNFAAFSRSEIRARKRTGGFPFLYSLATALGAKEWTRATNQADILEFSAAILGTNLSRGGGKAFVAGGAFTPDKPGHWIVAKTFFGDGDLECYLAIDPTAPAGMFFPKDDMSGPGIVREFSKLFDDAVAAETKKPDL
jgi:Zn-dependent protease